MSSADEGRKYTRYDKVDEWLLNQVAKHVDHDKIGYLARELIVEESVYSNISEAEDKAFKVRDSSVEEQPRSRQYKIFEISQNSYDSIKLIELISKTMIGSLE